MQLNCWDKLGYGLLVTILIFIFTALSCVIYSDKEHQGYYLNTYSSGGVVSYQVYNKINWSEDTVAFSTTDQVLALSTFEKLKGLK